MRLAPKQEIPVVTAFQFLQREHVSRYAQLLSLQFSKIHVHAETILRLLGNLLLFRCAPILTFTMCVIKFSIKLKMLFLIVANWPHLGAL